MAVPVYDLSHVCFAGAEPAPPRWWQAGAGSGVAATAGPLALRASFSPNRPRAFPSTRSDKVQPPDAFLVWLFRQAGLQAQAYRPEALQRRLPACLRALKVSSPEAAQALLEQRPELLGRAVDAVLIGVSGFFRDGEVFAGLRQRVLPELLRRRRGLRVYSAGCSDGQELYSVAILLEAAGALAESCLMGLDCRPEAIAHAQAGWFPAAELQKVDPEFRTRYFQPEGTRVQVATSLQEKACWQVGDLLTAPPAEQPWDLILFRNVAIYLGPEQAELWETLTRQLRPGGVLVTGKAERPPAGLAYKRIGPCAYQKSEQ